VTVQVPTQQGATVFQQGGATRAGTSGGYTTFAAASNYTFAVLG
jgi:hypothetical protein